MRYVEINHLTDQAPDAIEVIENFIDFAAEELELEELPQVVLMTGNELGTTFGAYVPGKKIVYLQIGNRHPVDVLRTLAHELVHFRQDLDDVLHDKSGEDGSEHENEANSEAGRIMRLFGKANPDLYRSSAILAEAAAQFDLTEKAAFAAAGSTTLYEIRTPADLADLRREAGRNSEVRGFWFPDRDVVVAFYGITHDEALRAYPDAARAARLTFPHDRTDVVWTNSEDMSRRLCDSRTMRSILQCRHLEFEVGTGAWWGVPFVKRVVR